MKNTGRQITSFVWSKIPEASESQFIFPADVNFEQSVNFTSWAIIANKSFETEDFMFFVTRIWAEQDPAENKQIFIWA